MDSITTAIVAAIRAIGFGHTVETGQQATIEDYEALKAALSQKFGADSDLIDAVEKLEKKPESFGRKEVLKEEIAVVRADQDLALLTAAQILLNRLDGPPDHKWPARALSLPLQRPDRADYFVGREESLAQLLAHLQPGRVMALCGPGGVGKKALIAEALWKLAPGEAPPERFPDGIVYYSFYNQPRVDIALEQIARLFGEEPTPNPYDAAQRTLAKRQALLVLQGVEQADDLPGILDLRGGCGVLATSHSPLDVIPGQQEIAPLPLDQAVTLLQAWGKSRATDSPAARRICELVGGLPLAVRLAGQYLVAQKEETTCYLAWLETTPLPDLDQSQRQQLSLSLLLEHSLAQISETARQFLAVVGLLALSPFDQKVVAETLAIETDQGLMAAIRKIFKQKSKEQMPDFNLTLAELVGYGLLRPVGQGYEISHVLVHTYARQHLTAPAKAIKRLAAIYVALAWEQSVFKIDDYATLEDNRPHFMQVLAECLQWEDWESAYGLAAAVEDYLDRRGYWAERVIANEIGLIAAWQLGRPSEGAWLGNLGDTYRTMGHARWAIKHFEKALDTARKIGDRHSQGNSLGNLGLAYRDLGQIEQARQYLEQALTILEEIGAPSAKFVRDWLTELEEE